MLRLHDVQERVGLKRAMIYRLIQRSQFPSPLKFGRASRWRKEEVDKWVRDNWNKPDKKPDKI